MSTWPFDIERHSQHPHGKRGGLGSAQPQPAGGVRPVRTTDDCTHFCLLHSSLFHLVIYTRSVSPRALPHFWQN